MSIIRTAEDVRTAPPGAASTRAAEWEVVQQWPRGVPFVMPSGLAAKPALAARVNHGQWIVDCPFCPSASMACATDHRFFCVNCLNAGAGGKWLAVIWPKNRDAIEAVLLERPNPHTRNWSMVETLQDLRAENAARIVGELFGVVGLH